MKPPRTLVISSVSSGRRAARPTHDTLRRAAHPYSASTVVAFIPSFLTSFTRAFWPAGLYAHCSIQLASIALAFTIDCTTARQGQLASLPACRPRLPATCTPSTFHPLNSCLFSLPKRVLCQRFPSVFAYVCKTCTLLTGTLIILSIKLIFTAARG